LTGQDSFVEELIVLAGIKSVILNSMGVSVGVEFRRSLVNHLDRVEFVVLICSFVVVFVNENGVGSVDVVA